MALDFKSPICIYVPTNQPTNFSSPNTFQMGSNLLEPRKPRKWCCIVQSGSETQYLWQYLGQGKIFVCVFVSLSLCLCLCHVAMVNCGVSIH